MEAVKYLQGILKQRQYNPRSNHIFTLTRECERLLAYPVNYTGKIMLFRFYNVV